MPILSRCFPLFVLGLFVPSSSFGAPIEYARDVRPILSQHCFKCHGPDEGQRKGGLRLDHRESALKGGKSGEPSIVPKDVAKSELIKRIDSHEKGEVMPPPAAKLELSETQKTILKNWIKEGAEYQQHWAFIPPEKRGIEQGVFQVKWVRNPIDHYVLANLIKSEVKPSTEADRYTLVRRVYLDLIGIPPTPEEADAFAKDADPLAYEKLVDKLLGSPLYGERWARKWLDLARYADTNGYEKDRPRSIWPYRDWVIKSINDDMPFDQFTIEQIAGDLLPGGKESRRVATGFHRNTMLNEEGGSDPREFRWHAINDRVATTGTVWLGLTVGCAQCHTHKYDPISHKEYYQLFAYLNNCDEITMPVKTPEMEARRAEILKKVAELRAALPKQFPLDPEADPKDLKNEATSRLAYLEFRNKIWRMQEAERAKEWTILKPEKVSAGVASLTVQPDLSVIALGDLAKQDTYTVTFKQALKDVKAIRIEVIPDERLPNKGPGRIAYEGPNGGFFMNEFTVFVGGQKVKFTKAVADYANGKNAAAGAIDGDPLSGWEIAGVDPNTKEPAIGKPHVAIFYPDKPINTNELKLEMFFERYYAASLGRFRLSVSSKAEHTDLKVTAPEIEDLLRKPYFQLTDDEKTSLRNVFLMQAPEVKKSADEIRALAKTMPEYPTTLVLQERPQDYPRPTNMHKRGEFTQPIDAVKPGIFGVLNPKNLDMPKDRLEFAKWLVSRENPLTARVTVNRAWASFFGRGLVRTTEDFGIQGELPTHPELLDWLAVEFMEKGWSMKHLHKVIVTSSTYRQSSKVTPESAKKDPKNELLSRGPRFRIEAEVIRDTTLKVSDLLSTKMYGPSVFPPQIPSITTEGAYGQLKWEVSKGEDRYRRGLYTFTKRTAPFASFQTFDGPSGEACIARREISNTPLQALTLLNDEAFLEAAQNLGKIYAGKDGTTEEKAKHLFRKILVRPPQDDEVKMLTKFIEAQRKRYADKKLDPAPVAGAQENATERAVWTALARVLLNTDELVTKD